MTGFGDLGDGIDRAPSRRIVTRFGGAGSRDPTTWCTRPKVPDALARIGLQRQQRVGEQSRAAHAFAAAEIGGRRSGGANTSPRFSSTVMLTSCSPTH